MTEHWFWYALSLAALIWYSSVTVYVAIKGVADIKTMLARLSEKQGEDE